MDPNAVDWECDEFFRMAYSLGWCCMSMTLAVRREHDWKMAGFGRAMIVDSRAVVL
jgi:hypothetical protein